MCCTQRPDVFDVSGRSRTLAFLVNRGCSMRIGCAITKGVPVSDRNSGNAVLNGKRARGFRKQLRAEAKVTEMLERSKNAPPVTYGTR